MSFTIAIIVTTVLGQLLPTESTSRLLPELWIESMTFLSTTDLAVRNSVRFTNKLSKAYFDVMDVFQVSHMAKGILPDEYHGLPDVQMVQTAQDYLRYVLDKPWKRPLDLVDSIHFSDFFHFMRTQFKYEWDQWGLQFILKEIGLNGDDGWISLSAGLSTEIAFGIQYNLGKALLTDNVRNLRQLLNATGHRQSVGYIYQMFLIFLEEGVPNRDKFVKLDFMKPDGWFNTRRLLIDSIRIQMNAALSLGDENQVQRILVGLIRSNGLDIVIDDRPYLWVDPIPEIGEQGKIRVKEWMKEVLHRNVEFIRDLPELMRIIQKDSV